MIEKDIIHRPDLNLGGQTIFRDAVRGIIFQDELLLMVYSEKNGDYKFPGGGVQPGETHPIALARELREECGAELTASGIAYARIYELDQALDEGVDIFKMLSTYYLCQIAPELGPQTLDDYEKDLGFRPVWIGLEEAICNNTAVLHQVNPPAPRWTYRDLYVLNEIKKGNP